jgi:hypothetical protein
VLKRNAFFLPFSSDIAMAISKTDLFDFLIDIVPRDDIKPQVDTRMMVFPPLTRTHMTFRYSLQQGAEQQPQYYFYQQPAGQVSTRHQTAIEIEQLFVVLHSSHHSTLGRLLYVLTTYDMCPFHSF